MHMLKKGQMTLKEGVKSLTPAAQFYALAADPEHSKALSIIPQKLRQIHRSQIALPLTRTVTPWA
jgi:hypothetical protein